jgi:hypothetical protein
MQFLFQIRHVKTSGGGTCKTLEEGPHTMAAQGPHEAKSGPADDIVT